MPGVVKAFQAVRNTMVHINLRSEFNLCGAAPPRSMCVSTYDPSRFWLQAEPDVDGALFAFSRVSTLAGLISVACKHRLLAGCTITGDAR